MNDSRRFGGVEYSLLLLVLVAAGGARGWYVGTCAQNGTNAGPLQVQDATAGGWTNRMSTFWKIRRRFRRKPGCRAIYTSCRAIRACSMAR